MGRNGSMRAMKLILDYAGKKPVFGLKDAVFDLDLDRGTVFRYLNILCETKWLNRVEDGREVVFIAAYRSPQALRDYLDAREFEQESK